MTDNGFLRCSDHKSQEAYQKAIDKAIGEKLTDYSRKKLNQDLLVYEKESDDVVRLVFFDQKDMLLYLSYMLESDKTDTINQYGNDELLFLNCVLRFAKFSRDLDGKTDLNYAYSVKNMFCMSDLGYYLDQMEQTLKELQLK